MFDGANILITGGTGAFGRACIRRLLSAYEPARVCVFSRDEVKHEATLHEFNQDKRLRPFLGSIRQQDRLDLAMRGIDYVIHAAALKRIELLEYNPWEAVHTNIIGSWNVIRAALNRETVKQVIGISTDKACAPVLHYGRTKAVMESLFVDANFYAGGHEPRFSCIRYGNVANSTGSVIPLWRRAVDQGQPLPITDYRMTRFWLTLDDAVSHVLSALEEMHGGEIFIPQLPSVRLIDLADAVAANHPRELIGVRGLEKLHESLVSPDESMICQKRGRWYLLHGAGERVPEGFAYRSDLNHDWLAGARLREAVENL